MIAPLVKECPDCMRQSQGAALTAWQDAMRAGLPAMVDAKLAAAGIAPRESTATTRDIPVALKRLIVGPAKALVQGAALAADFRGFGLSGGQGIGKTFAVAALLRRRLELRLQLLIEHTEHVPDPWPGEAAWHAAADEFLWVNWPDAAASVKATITERDGSAAVNQRVLAWRSVPLLVLDDLGRERLSRAAANDDYAVGLLDQVIDARSRAGNRPVVWTSNLNPAALTRRYGAALGSRLLGMAPAVVLPPLADLRLHTAP